MGPSEFITRYPKLWHMAELGCWPTIEKHGLRSTTALLDLFEVTGQERFALESEHRRESVKICHPKHGTAVVRDQKPILPTVLDRCLTDMTPREWYETLNRRVFFWVSEKRLNKMLGAGEYHARSHSVLTIRTEALLAAHLDDITLSPLNSGATHPSSNANHGARGSYTFRCFDAYPWQDRPRSEPVVELAVDYAVPNIADMVIDVSTRRVPRAEK